MRAPDHWQGSATERAPASASTPAAEWTPPKGTPPIRTLLEFVAWLVHSMEGPLGDGAGRQNTEGLSHAIGSQRVSLRHDVGSVEEAAKRIKVPNFNLPGCTVTIILL